MFTWFYRLLVIPFGITVKSVRIMWQLNRFISAAARRYDKQLTTRFFVSFVLSFVGLFADIIQMNAAISKQSKFVKLIRKNRERTWNQITSNRLRLRCRNVRNKKKTPAIVVVWRRVKSFRMAFIAIQRSDYFESMTDRFSCAKLFCLFLILVQVFFCCCSGLLLTRDTIVWDVQTWVARKKNTHT